MRRPAVTALFLLLAFNAPTAPAGTPAAPDWKQVVKTGGHLAFVRDLAAFGLERPAAELSAAFENAAALDEDRRDIARALLLTAWLRRDPQGARKARQTAAPPWNEQELAHYFRALAGVSAGDALGEIDALPPSPARSQYLLLALSRLAELDPQRAAGEIRSRLPQAGDDAQWLLGVWGGFAPEDALAALGSIPDEKQRDLVKQHLLHAWLLSSPEKALRWTLENEDAARRDERLAELAHALGYDDWDALRRLADNTSDSALRAILEKAAADTMASQGPEKLWGQIQAKGWDGVPSHALNSLLEYAGTRPREEAVAFWRSVPSSLVDGEHASDLLSEPWTLADPDGALAWARSIADARLRDYTLLHINSMLTELDPDLAIAQIEQTPPGKLQGRMMRNTALAIAKTDLARATEWTFSLPAGESRDQALQGLAIAAARNQGKAFAGQIEKLPAGPARAHLVAEFSQRWLKEDAAAASAWVFALPDGPERKAAFRPALEALAAQAPDAAFALLPTLSSAEDKLSLVRELGEHQAVAHTEKVLAAIGALSDGPRKKAILANTLSELAKDDPVTMSGLIAEGAFGPVSSSVVSNTLINWTGAVPDAVAWVDRLLREDSLTAARDRPAIASSLVNWMTGSDPVRAVAWVEDLPEGQTRARAAGELAARMAHYRPVESFQLAVRFGVSDSSLQRTVETLARLAPAQAGALVRDSALPENRKAKALSWIQP